MSRQLYTSVVSTGVLVGHSSYFQPLESSVQMDGRCNSAAFVLSGQVWSWGDGDYGKLGRGGSDGCKTPKLVEKLQDLDVVKVRCGSQFSVALTKDGQVYSWGKGDNQRLGHGTEEHVRYPKLLEGLQGKRGREALTAF